MASMGMSLNLAGAFRGLSLSSSSSSSCFRGDSGSVHVGHKIYVPFPLNSTPLTIESAHKKGAGSTKNGRDSKGNVVPSSIQGRMLDLIFSLIDGMVKFELFGPEKKKKVSVYPREVQPENPNSYRARKRESFRLQRERRKARREAKIDQPLLVLASVDEIPENSTVC
ncbi:hypothetical protein Leryth_013356 [Lithospermum erythrorhizon]|nr:hypothetical protein Leryth_013356 [Lithospermum erythrorhizon]